MSSHDTDEATLDDYTRLLRSLLVERFGQLRDTSGRAQPATKSQDEEKR